MARRRHLPLRCVESSGVAWIATLNFVRHVVPLDAALVELYVYQSRTKVLNL